MSSHRPRLTAGMLMLALAIAALAGFWYAKSRLEQPEGETAPMPPQQFSQNEALAMPEGERPLDWEGVTPEQLIELLAGYTEPETLFWRVETTVYSKAGSRTRQGSLDRVGEDYTLEIIEAGEVPRRLEKRGDVVTVGGSSIAYSAAYRPLRQLGMADIDYLQEVDPASVVSAGWGELDGRQVLCAQLSDPLIEQTEFYWISLDYGLPLRCETYEGDTLVYLATTIEIS